MTGSPLLRVASVPTMEASAPSPRCVWPRMTPGCSTNVRFTRSSNSRMRSICVYIQISRSLPSCSAGCMADLRESILWNAFAGLSNLADRIANRHLGPLARKNLQQNAIGGRIEFVVYLFRFQLDDRVAALHGFAFLLQPTHHVDFRGRQATGLRHFERGDDGGFSVHKMENAPQSQSLNPGFGISERKASSAVR